MSDFASISSNTYLYVQHDTKKTSSYINIIISHQICKYINSHLSAKIFSIINNGIFCQCSRTRCTNAESSTGFEVNS
ncbi:unnamed protein product [Heterobilharzia americana]|nr:unnamed protein product [Heterobilharzia americana]